MDNIDEDINRAKVGKKEERLVGWDHLHKKNAFNTKMQPMGAIKKATLHVCDTCAFTGIEFDEYGVKKIFCKRIKRLIKKHINDYCSFWIPTRK